MAASICATILDHARRAPDPPAIRRDGRTTTYGELVAIAGALAAGLRERGIDEGDRVALAVAPGRDLVAAMIAVAAVGAAYLPLDNRDRSRRLADILTAGRCPLVIVDDTSP